MAKYKPKDGVISFRKATQHMNIKEKLAYIFAYYKKLVIGIPLGILILFYLVNNFMSQKETYLNVAVINGFYHTITQLRQEHEDFLATDEASEHQDGFDLNLSGLTVALDQLLFDEVKRENYEIFTQHLWLNIDSIPIFVTLTAVGDLDMIISYEFDFEAMNDVGHFQNIRDLNINVPNDAFVNDYGILLNDISFFDAYIRPTNPDINLILAVPAGSHRIYTVENFLNTLFD